MTDTNVVVSPTNVELGEVAGIMQLVNEVRDSDGQARLGLIAASSSSPRPLNSKD